MAEYPLMSQMQGPQIDVSLFPEAMKAGAAVGNAVKTPLQAALESITTGVKTYEDLETTNLAQEKAKQDIALEPVRAQAELAQKQAYANYMNSQAQIEALKAQEEQATQESSLAQKVAEQKLAAATAQNKLDDINIQNELSSAVSNASKSGSAAQLNQVLGDSRVRSYLYRNPTSATAIFGSMPQLPDLDQNLVSELNDFSSRRLIQAQYQKAMEDNRDAYAKARGAAMGSPFATALVQDVGSRLGRTVTLDEVAPNVRVEDTGTFKVTPDGQRLPVSAEEYNGTPKDRDRKDVFYQDPATKRWTLIRSNVNPKEQGIDEVKALSGLIPLYNGEALRSELDAYTRRKTAPSPEMQGPPASKPPSTFSAGVMEALNPQSKTFSPQKAMTNFYWSSKSGEAVPPELHPALKKISNIQSDAVFTENIPKLNRLLNNVQKNVDEGNFTSAFGLIPVMPEEVYQDQQELAKALAHDSYQANVANQNTPENRGKYGPAAVAEYQKVRNQILEEQTLRSSPYYWGEGSIISKLGEGIDPTNIPDVTTSEDLYYIKNKRLFDAQAAKVVTQMKESFYRDSKTPYLVEDVKAESIGGLQTPTAPPKQTFNVAAELSGEARGEENIPATSKTMTPEDVKSLVIASAKKHGVPEEVALNLVQQESKFRPDVKNPNSSAYGPMQLIASTAKALGVNQYDPAQNIEGGMGLLMTLYKKYKNWKDALTAYHDGETEFNKNKGPIPGNEESLNYAPSILKGTPYA